MRAALCAVMIAVAACGGATRLVVAAGTTITDPGLMDRIADEYERTHPGVEVSIVGDATSRVLALARNGEADVTVTHHPELEAAFRAEDGASITRPVFSSRFLLVGPGERAAGVEGMDAPAALRLIAERGWAFVTRNDGSGTHRAERLLWEEAGVRPDDAVWYLDTGQGMGLTLQVASQRRAFTIAEEGSFRIAAPTLDLIAVDVTGMPPNRYVAMAVAGTPVEAAASVFVEWLASPDGAEAVEMAQAEMDGLVYVPDGRGEPRPGG